MHFPNRSLFLWGGVITRSVLRGEIRCSFCISKSFSCALVWIVSILNLICCLFSLFYCSMEIVPKRPYMTSITVNYVPQLNQQGPCICQAFLVRSLLLCGFLERPKQLEDNFLIIIHQN